jgi:hypothetical protein
MITHFEIKKACHETCTGAPENVGDYSVEKLQQNVRNIAEP